MVIKLFIFDDSYSKFFHYKGCESDINSYNMEYSKDLNHLFLEKVHLMIK